MVNNKLVLGSQSSRAATKPARVQQTIFKYAANCIPQGSNTGATFQLIADNGPYFPAGRDTAGVRGTGLKLTDYFTTDTISQFDYFRINKVEYVVSLSNIPRQTVPNVRIYASEDYDNAEVANFLDLYKRPNKSLTVLTGTAPTQTLITYQPRRRISSNVDPSQQIITSPKEWCDCAYASTLIFGNLKLGILVPDGQVQYTVSDQASVLVTSKIWVEFKGRITD